MLSMSNVSSGQAGNYYQKDDYYAREEHGQWQGKLADHEGLQGDVQPQDLQEQFNAQKNPERVGVDLTFSAPKSCSMAMHLDDKTRADVLDAHNKAVETTLRHAEQNCIFYRQTENHVTTPRQSDNMACARFNHYVSRAQDPQLHTHAVILNQTLCADGRVRAISNEKLYDSKMLLGQMYRSELARNLQEKGYQLEVTNREKGFFELKGITREQVESFSTRRAEIEAQLKAWDKSGATGATAERAALLSREAKQASDLGKLAESWRETYKEIGINSGSLERGSFRQASPEEIRGIMDKMSNSLSEQSFAFRRVDFERACLREGLGQGITNKDVDQYIQGNLQSKEMVGATFHNFRGFPTEQLTTKGSIALEKSIFDRVGEGKGKYQGVDKAIIQNHLAGTKLSAEQKAAVQHICGSRDRYAAIQGYAGTGKTYMLNEARQVWEKAGYEVKGMAFTGKAAEGLQTGAGIESSTIHRHLNNLEKEAGGRKQGEDYTNKKDWNLDNLHKANKPQVWVVDEASMVNNKLLSQLQIAAEKKGAQVVMIGDKRQLQPIGPGNSFSQLVNQGKIAHYEMKDIQRQKDPGLRSAVIDAAQGKIRESVDKMAAHTTEIKDRGERLNQIAKDYASQKAEDRKESVIITGSNRDRNELNAQVREELKAKGELKPGQQYEIKGQGNAKGTREFAQGDKVIFLQNDRQMGVSNGQTGYIREINGNSFKIDSGGKQVDLNLNEYNRLDHGYAMTTHKGQGITENKAFIHLDTNQKQLNSANAYYVDISRARHEARIYTDDKGKLLSSVERQQEKLSSKDFAKASPWWVRDPQDRHRKQEAFKELPKQVQNQVLKGDRCLARAEASRQEAAQHGMRAEALRDRAENYRDSRPAMAEKLTRSAFEAERKAGKTTYRAEKHEAKAERNYARAVETNDRVNQKHGTDRELKLNPDRPGVTIGSREESRTKPEPTRDDGHLVRDQAYPQGEPDRKLGPTREEAMAPTDGREAQRPEPQEREGANQVNEQERQHLEPQDRTDQSQGQELEAPLKDSSPQIDFNEAEVKAWLQDRELGIIDDPKEFDMDRELEPLEGIFDEGPGQEREGPEQVQEQQHAMPAPSIPEPEISGPSWER